MSDTDDSALSGDLDAMAPWTIRAISGRAREAALNAARAEKVTVGVWLERRIREWTEAAASGGTALALTRPEKAAAREGAAAPDSVDLIRLASEISTGPNDPLMKNARATLRVLLAKARQ